MKRNCLILTILVAASVCILQIGFQEQTVAAEEPKPESTAAKPAGGPAKAETAPEANEPAPKITIEKAIHDFGKIEPGTKNACEFKFKNTGNSLLKIGKIKTTCGCTATKLSKKQYEERPRLALTIKAQIIKKVNYEPKQLNLSLVEENASCPKITLSSLDNQLFAIKQFKSTPDCITADCNSSVRAGKFVLQPIVNMEKLQKGKRGYIEISLTHPEYDTIIIPFNTLSKFKAEPPSLIVFKAEPQEPTTKEVWILSNYDEDFEVESASSQKNIVKILGQEKVGKRYKFELEITPPAVVGKRKVFSDVFFVNIKGGEKLKITCRGFYSKKHRNHQANKS